MDFQKLLSVADYNKEEAKSEASIKRCSTVLAPPKKPPKLGVQSQNVKRFLEKKKAEEERIASCERKKKLELLGLRAQNSKNNKKAKIMASRTKDNDFSKIKLTEDEIESKKKIKAELIRQNLNNKVERMKARIEMEEQEKLLPKKRKRKSKQGCDDKNKEPNNSSNQVKNSKCDELYMNKNQEIKVKRPPPKPSAPLMSFHDLLKVAEVKQFEPVEIPKKKKQEEKLLTKKEHRQILEEQERLRRKQEIQQRGISTSSKLNSDSLQNKKTITSLKKTTNTNSGGKVEESVSKKPYVVHVEKSVKPNSGFSKNSNTLQKSSINNRTDKKPITVKNMSTNKINNVPKTDVSNVTNKICASPNSVAKVKKVPVKNKEKIEKTQLPSAPSLSEDVIAAIEKRIREKVERELEERFSAKFKSELKPHKEVVSKNLIERKVPENSQQNENTNKPITKPQNRTKINETKKQLPSNSRNGSLISSKFVERDKNHLQRKPVPFHHNPYLDPPRRLLEPQRPAKLPAKRRIESDDDDDDDDEMSDFIDNGPSQNDDDYSKYIKEIFGYDKSRYMDDDDDEVIESSFVEQMKEETRSAKLGYLEDLEEERKEKEEIKRKMKKKKK